MEKELLRADEADLVPEVFLKQKTEKSLNKYHLLFSLWNTMPFSIEQTPHAPISLEECQVYARGIEGANDILTAFGHEIKPLLDHVCFE